LLCLIWTSGQSFELSLLIQGVYQNAVTTDGQIEQESE
jgi:hypothetical protein